MKYCSISVFCNMDVASEIIPNMQIESVLDR